MYPALGAEKLAEALLESAVYSPSTEKLVVRLVSSGKENSKRYREKLADLKNGDDFYGWNDAYAYSRELEEILEILKEAEPDPDTGFKLITEFYETDTYIMERCDDSLGSVGMVFGGSARELFSQFTLRCTDRQIVADTLLRLVLDDQYGVRAGLIEAAQTCLNG